MKKHLWKKTHKKSKPKKRNKNAQKIEASENIFFSKQIELQYPFNTIFFLSWESF